MDTHFQSVRQELMNHSEKKVAEFNSKLNPNISSTSFLGVRIPAIRKIAKEIVKNDWKVYLDESKNAQNRYEEEVLLEGLVIAYAKIDLKERIKLIKKFVPKITTWITNDCFCSTIKLKKEELPLIWKFILPYLKSNNEFEVRFAVIMMLDNYIIDEYVDQVIEKLDQVNHDGYYAKMAVAWTMAEIGIKYHEKAMTYLTKNCHLDEFTYRKTLQKMRESYRISDEVKEELKKMIQKIPNIS